MRTPCWSRCSGMLTRAAVCFALVVGCLGSPRLRSQETELSAEDQQTLRTILKDWEDRRKLAQQVRCAIRGKVTVPKGWHNSADIDPNGTHPAKETTFATATSLMLDFKQGRMRRDERGKTYSFGGATTPTPAGFRQLYWAKFYDGIDYARFEPHSENNFQPPFQPEILFWQHDGRRFFEGSDMPVLFALGIVPFDRPLANPHELFLPTQTPIIVVGREMDELLGRTYVVLRTQPLRGSHFCKTWVDPQQQSAVVRQEVFSERGLIRSTVIRYRDTPRGYFPESWTEKWWGAVDEPRIQESRLVEFDLQAKFTDHDFRIEPAPDVTYFDQRDGRDPVKRLPATGQVVPAAPKNKGTGPLL